MWEIQSVLENNVLLLTYAMQDVIRSYSHTHIYNMTSTIPDPENLQKYTQLMYPIFHRFPSPVHITHHQTNPLTHPAIPTTLLTPTYPAATTLTVAITKVWRFLHSTPRFLSRSKAVYASFASRSVVVVVSYCGMYLNSKTVSPPRPWDEPLTKTWYKPRRRAWLKC